jgi:hypothetical protein
MVPIARAVATDEPDIAANSVQATTVTSGDVNQRLGNAAVAHEGGRHNEQRQRHQCRRIQMIDDDLRDTDQRFA